MTDRNLLELIADKVIEMEERFDEIDERFDSLEGRLISLESDGKNFHAEDKTKLDNIQLQSNLLVSHVLKNSACCDEIKET